MDNQADESGKTKLCVWCQRTLPLSDFNKNKGSRDGLQTYCRSCQQQSVLEWQKREAGKANIKNARWKARHKDQVLSANAVYRETNRDRLREYNREYMQQKRAAMSPEELSAHYRAGDLWKHYRLRPEQYDAMFEAQGRVCAICKTADFGARRPHVDHSHATGKNRGLLCQHCNTTLHQLDVTPGWVEAAARYLNLHKGD